MIFLIKYYIAFVLSFFSRQKKNNFILMYHKISKVSINKDIFSVSYKKFTKQILFLKDHFNLVNLNDVDKHKNSFSVTFDDGFDDLYNLVFPFIKKYKINITIFLTLNNLDKNGYLTSSELREMLESGLVDLGCHGNTHISLKNIDVKKLKNEIEFPKNYLETFFDTKIFFFSFPNGRYDLDAIKYCKDAGFRKVFNSALRTFNNINNLYIFPRICVYKYDNIQILLHKVKGKFDFLNINPNE